MTAISISIALCLGLSQAKGLNFASRPVNNLKLKKARRFQQPALQRDLRNRRNHHATILDQDWCSLHSAAQKSDQNARRACLSTIEIFPRPDQNSSSDLLPAT
jgi:hypothetical protein